MPDPSQYPYKRGTVAANMPMASIPEHCVTISAGPIDFVVEARDLDFDQGLAKSDAEKIGWDDFGGSLHITGAIDGIEHLRFDCFHNDPHYHYITAKDKINLVCRLDDIAEGDPIEWTIGRIRHRLPEMLKYAGAIDLAEAVQGNLGAVVDALNAVRDALENASRSTAGRRGLNIGAIDNGT